jgi:UDP-N-acetylmuramyl pentapeptide phosphotransferase/UDP-N-acetylglucosamine-1-phosphate transferase
VLVAGMLIYFKIADKWHIINKPTQCGSHNYIAIRGGGIIFWLAGVLFSLSHFQESIYFLIGFTLICGVSFWDDISSLPAMIRIIIHFLSVSPVFYSLHFLGMFPWWLILIAYVLLVGAINAYNFMDGINGITGLYSLVVLAGLQYVNLKMQPFTNPDFIYYAILACLVFLFFNYRKQARCFAGDIGSIGISFWIVTLLLQAIMATSSWIWILFLTVYGVDTVCTIIHRLYLRQNIFQSHRLHFYQVLANERQWSHLTVSMLYAVLQLIVCIIVVLTYRSESTGFIALACYIIVPLIAVYILKFRWMRTDEMKRDVVINDEE